MDRLTLCAGSRQGQRVYCLRPAIDIDNPEHRQQLISLLGAFEDTKITPQQITAMQEELILLRQRVDTNSGLETPKKSRRSSEDVENQTDEKPAKKSFVKPTVDEVKAYCKERGKGVDPERWWNYYEANGWKVGKNPMRNWQAAVRTWEKGYAVSPPPQKQDDNPYSAANIQDLIDAQYAL